MTEILYHYCSTESFLSIIQNQSIWLSSLKLSNDSAEGKVFAETMIEKARASDWNYQDIQEFEDLLARLVENADALGFCLTEEADLLSQWRGYADDGRGLCIGFSKNFLSELIQRESAPNGLFQVIYSKEQQETLIQDGFTHISKLVKKGALKSTGGPLPLLGTPLTEDEIKEIEELSRKFHYEVFGYLTYFFLAKGKAFAEEKEWRLLLPLVQLPSGSSRTPSRYRADKNQIRPYQSLKITKGSADTDDHPIREVILGPKHQTPINNIEEFLTSHGYTNTVIKQSAATYR